jgi:hypothetical protein
MRKGTLPLAVFARFVAGMCAAALLFGDLLHGIHLLTARHAVCIAHGELVEAPETLPGSRAERPDASARAYPSEPAVEHHEHCSAAAALSQPLPAHQIEAHRVAVDPPAFALIACPELTTAHGRRVLNYAPKQGPPA